MCPKPVLFHANQLVWEMFQVLQSQARVAGMGGILGVDFTAIDFVFRMYEVPAEDEFIYFTQIVEVFNVATSIWNRPKEGKRS